MTGQKILSRQDRTGSSNNISFKINWDLLNICLSLTYSMALILLQYEWMEKDMATVDRSKTSWLIFIGNFFFNFFILFYFIFFWLFYEMWPQFVTTWVIYHFLSF